MDKLLSAFPGLRRVETKFWTSWFGKKLPKIDIKIGELTNTLL